MLTLAVSLLACGVGIAVFLGINQLVPPDQRELVWTILMLSVFAVKATLALIVGTTENGEK